MTTIDEALKELREERDLNESINVSELIKSLEINGISYKEFLDELLDYVSPKTVEDIYKKLLGEKSTRAEQPRGQTQSRLSQETIRNRVRLWFEGKKSYAFSILNAFLLLSGNDLSKEVSRQDLCDKVCELSGSSEQMFLTIFRQMCSDAGKAYGNIFIYHRSSQSVSINPNYRDEIKKYID